jgi:predicted transcriptional regulator
VTKPSDVIISIRPNFAEAIFSGVKTIELRRRVPQLPLGTRLWIYATKPAGAVLGCAVVDGVISGSLEEIWAASSEHAGVSRVEFDDYFAGSEKAVALRLVDVKRGQPVPIAKLQTIRPGFHPPQTIARISASESHLLGGMAFGGNH